MSLTLDTVLENEFKIEDFRTVFMDTILNCMEQKFIEGDDSKIIDILIYPDDNFNGKFKVTVRKQIIDVFDITTHMVYIAADGIKDKYISTVNVDFTSQDKTIIDESAQKIIKVTENIAKLLDTIKKDFKCVTFYINIKEFEIYDTLEEKEAGVLKFDPFIGDPKTVIQKCMSTLIDEYISRDGFMKSSKIVMNNTMEIECDISSVGIKSKGKLVFLMNHMSKVDGVQFCVVSIPFIEEEKDQPYGLAVALDSPNCKLSKGGLCLNILEAELFGYKYQNQDNQVMGYIAEYINAIAEEVDKWISIMSSNHKITLNVESEVV